MKKLPTLERPTTEVDGEAEEKNGEDDSHSDDEHIAFFK